MNFPAQFLRSSEAAKRLGASAKALRLYEQRGLLTPIRTETGWRAYGPDEMARAAEVVALRALGLSIAHIARVLDGDVRGLEAALATHQATLECRVHQISGAIEKVRAWRADPALGKPLVASSPARLLKTAAELVVAFDLPWPWGGERFELYDVRPLNYIIGPLGSGKTRLAQRLAQTLPGAAFVGLERLAHSGSETRARLEANPGLQSRVDRTLALLVEDGAAASQALVALLAGLEAEGPAFLVVDMLEQGLDQATQEALIAHLRRRGPGGRPLFVLTRSRSILDLTSVGPDEAIILCPANHNPPMHVDPVRGAPGYEAVATCLASPEVRARVEGVIAWRPQVA